jgi:hypothetical protein
LPTHVFLGPKPGTPMYEMLEKARAADSSMRQVFFACTSARKSLPSGWADQKSLLAPMIGHALGASTSTPCRRTFSSARNRARRCTKCWRRLARQTPDADSGREEAVDVVLDAGLVGFRRRVQDELEREDPRRVCDQRQYEYTLPTHVFLGPKPGTPMYEMLENCTRRIDQTRIPEGRKLLMWSSMLVSSAFEGGFKMVR